MASLQDQLLKAGVINKNKAKKPWITRGILRSIATRNRLYKKALRSKVNTDLDKYKII